MATREEKLAAARRKLKEFQGKNKDNDARSRCSNDSAAANRYWEDSSQTGRTSVLSNTSSIGTPIFSEDPVKPLNENIPKISSFFENSPSFPILQKDDNPKNFPYSSDNSYHLQESNNVMNSISNNRTPVTQLGYENQMKAMIDLNIQSHNDYQTIETEVNNEANQTPALGRVDNASPKKSFDETRSTPNSEAGLADVMRPLQLQLQSHVQTISILVSERNDLQAVLTKTQLLLQEKSGEVEEMQGRLHISNLRINELETNLSNYTQAIQNIQRERDELANRQQTLLAEDNLLKEARQEMFERFEAKKNKCEELEATIEELKSQLSLSEIKLQQFVGSTSTAGPQLFELEGENKRLVHKIQEMEKTLQQAVSDKEHSSQHFHVYAQQCNSQISLLKKQVESMGHENQKLKDKIETLTKTLQENETPLSEESWKKEISDLHSQLAELKEAMESSELENKTKIEELENFKIKLDERDNEICALTKALDERQELYRKLQTEMAAMEGGNSTKKLLEAMESDKVAAARAVSQNMKLKEQLVELEQGFIRVSDEKLDLTEKLEHERHVNKKLTEKLQAFEDGGHDHHHAHEDGEHCHEHEHKEEENVDEMRNIIRQLQEDKSVLLARLNAQTPKMHHFHLDNNHKHDHGHKHDHDHNYDHDHEHNHDNEEASSEVVRQMEAKLRRTMDEIAVLDEEKERLEHLVLQLQGETETIGEYVSLYQKQRLMLRQRTIEKDEQLIQLSQDREELKMKLAALDNLVQSLLAGKDTSSPVNTQPHAVEEDTADKIRNLMTEIGSSSLMSPHAVSFEHCPCCSGRLITI